ncbi:MAG: hypothetical protein Q8M18_10400 [Bradyrhizobium sp.]|nr:hypothetical protein [Bradyrhizobium sp.]
MYDDGSLSCPQTGKKQNPAFVKLLATVSGPSGHGMNDKAFWGTTEHAADGTIEN